MSVSSFDETWPLGFSEADRDRFTALAMDSFSSRSIAVGGSVPDLVLPGGGLLNLRNLAASCDRLDRDQWPSEIDHFIEMVSAQSSHLDLSSDVARASLRLRLLLDDGSHNHLVIRPSLPGLAVAMFIRRPGMGQSVSLDMLDAWGLSVDEAFELAEANSWQLERGEVIDYEDVSVLEGDSLFTSTGVLRLTEWFDPGEHGVILAVPTRHVVVVRRMDGEMMSMIGGFAQLAQELMDSGAGPTSSLVWFVEPATFGRWGEGAELVSIDVVNAPGVDARLEVGVGPKLGDALERIGHSQLG